MVCPDFIRIVFVFILITCLNIKEKSTVDVDAPSIKQMFKALLQNDQAMTVVITIVLINTSVYITSNLVIYFLNMISAVRTGTTAIRCLTPLAVQYRYCR